jgi:hypothetical protein
LSDPAAFGMLEQIKAILRCIPISNTEVKKAVQFSELQSFFGVRTSVCPWGPVVSGAMRQIDTAGQGYS